MVHGRFTGHCRKQSAPVRQVPVHQGHPQLFQPLGVRSGANQTSHVVTPVPKGPAKMVANETGRRRLRARWPWSVGGLGGWELRTRPPKNRSPRCFERAIGKRTALEGPSRQDPTAKDPLSLRAFRRAAHQSCTFLLFGTDNGVALAFLDADFGCHHTKRKAPAAPWLALRAWYGTEKRKSHGVQLLFVVEAGLTGPGSVG